MVIYFTHRQIVLPGQLLAEGRYKVSGGAYAEGNRIYASCIGLAELRDSDTVHVIPLASVYVPRVGDIVIGKVIEVEMTGWQVDIKSPYRGFLPASEYGAKEIDLTRERLVEILKPGDIVVAKVVRFDIAGQGPLLTTKDKKLGKKVRGVLVEINPAKVPRVIGRKGSMVQMIKQMLSCDIIVGQNGRILINCESPECESFAAFIIKYIEKKSHVPGLTEEVRSIIEKFLKGELRYGIF